MSLRAKIFIIAVLSSSLAWIAWFNVTRYAYHQATEVGVIPNLHIKERLRRTFGDEPDFAPQP